MALVRDLFERSTAFFQRTVKFTNAAVCELKKNDYGMTYLLGAIYLTMRQLAEQEQLGMIYFRVTPIVLTTEPQKIIAKEPDGRLRKVSFAIDSAVGGPTPTIRFGNSSVTAGNGGARINAGVINEFGEVAPNAEIWAAASTTISGYIIERA